MRALAAAWIWFPPAPSSTGESIACTWDVAGSEQGLTWRAWSATIGAMDGSGEIGVRAAVREQYRTADNFNARLALHGRFSTNRYGIFRFIFDRMRLAEDARILEIGSGTGLLWRQNSGRIPRGCRIIVSDLSDGMLRETIANIGAIVPSLTAAQLDAQALPFRDGSFDVIVANHMLYHVPDIPRALGEIRRVLAPGGAFFAATNGSASMKEFRDAVRAQVGIELPDAARRFGLENGYELMRAVFAQVEIFRYPDQLVVTEAQPLIDYAASTSAGKRMSESDRNAMRAYFEQRISDHRAFRISKDTGVLVARA